MNEHKLFAQRIGLVGLVHLVINLKSLLILPILSKSLGTDGYGIWSLLIVTISLFTPLIGLGLISSITRYIGSDNSKEANREDLLSSLIVILAIGALFTILFSFISPFLADRILHDTSTILLLKVSSYIILLSSLDQLLLNYLRSKERIVLYSVFLLIESLAELLFIIFVLYIGLGLFGAVLSLLFARIVSLVLKFIFVYNDLGLSIPQFKRTKAYLAFGLPLLPSYLFVWVINLSDRYFLGYLMNNSSVGVYSAACGIGGIISLFVGPISVVLYPTISRLWDQKRESDVAKYINYSTKYFLMLAIPASFGLSILSKDILITLTSDQFIEASSLIPFLALGSIFSGLYSIYLYALATMGKTKIVGMLLIISAILNIILNIILIPCMGVLGAAISTLTCYIILSASMYIKADSIISLKLDYAFIFKSVLASLIMAIVVLWLHHITVELLIIISVFIYLLLLCILGAINNSERSLFVNLFKIN